MSKYIDADKLIAEIERRMQENADKALLFGAAFAGRTAEDNEIKNFIDSLQQEQPTKGYDESYLNECIAKASKTWENVDVDKYMDEVRGREQEQVEVDLEKEIDEWYEGFREAWENGEWSTNDIKSTARHFFELGINARKEE